MASPKEKGRIGDSDNNQVLKGKNDIFIVFLSI